MTIKRLILLALGMALIATFVSKAKSHRASEWHGLTESEARSKLDAKLPTKIPAEKRSAISDKVVSKMRDRGVLAEDESASESAEADDAVLTTS